MTADSTLTFEQTYGIRSYEPRPGGEVSIITICNHLQDIASGHADSLGFGYRDLKKSGHFWLLARLHVMMDRLPVYGGSATVTTWPSGNERLVALRDFTLRDENGPTGHATTSWVTMNVTTHRPDSPESVLDARLIPDIAHSLEFPGKAVQRLKDGEHETTVKARKTDIDINGHVNNVRYVEYCFEAVPDEWLVDYHCLGLDIQFRSESFAGDEYRAACSRSDAENGRETMLHSLIRSSDDKEIVRMRTWWECR